MKQIDGLVTKDEMYRLISGFRTRFKISEEAGHEMAKRVAEMPTIEAITREQFAEVVKQLMNEFTANDGYGTSASATFLALCFGNLELRLFKCEDGDNRCG